VTTILEVRDLVTKFYTLDGVVNAVNGVSFDLDAGETLAIVGESGSGKSVTMMSLLGLIPCPPGKIEGGTAHFTTEEGSRDLLQLSIDELREVRGGQIGFVFQDPISTLNPILTIGEQITETLTRHLKLTKHEARERTIKLLASVGIPDPELRYKAYPFQFSGGMRQRVVIAIALALRPSLLIMDEPTTALDVVVQKDILQQIERLKEELGFSILFITHDLSLMVEFSDRIGIMYAGELVEMASAERILNEPVHPYTQGLLTSFPSVTGEKTRLSGIPGSPPNLMHPPKGCRFHPRCTKCQHKETEVAPVLTELRPGHWVAIHEGMPLPDWAQK